MSVVAIPVPPVASAAPARPDATLVRALRARDEDAYLTLVHRYTPLMLRVAGGHVGSRAAAEDVVQDTWVAVLRNIDGFEARSSFKTWLMRILVNTARTRRVREARAVCMGTLPEEISRWADTGRPDRPGPPDPEGSVLAGESRRVVEDALATLPPRQRTVVELRDVAGWSSDEVCHALHISPGNQRLLLHRGRVALRAVLAPHLAPSAAAPIR
jgi:RNA polymerase sigma-70 factor (ECF subfamily)